MDKVIVTGLPIIGAVTAAVVVIVTLGPTIGSSSQSVVESQREASGRIKTSIEIIAISATGDRIDAWVKNVGVDPIVAIDRSDVFLEGRSEGRFDRMTYSSTGGSKTWTGDLKENSLSWARGDTLHVNIKLTDAADNLSAADHVLKFSTPNGITAEKHFSR